MTIPPEPKNCCCCQDGSLDPRWENVTKVRPAGDTLGPNYTSAPFPRLDPSDPDATATCADEDTPAGTCGGWIASLATNSLSGQTIDPAVKDIQDCAADDDAHRTLDMNCYQTALAAAGDFISGATYKIVTVGTTDFTAIGAAVNTVGTIFTASDAGSGTGTAQQMVDTRGAARRGGKWLLARKCWHGKSGLIDQDDPQRPTGIVFDAGDTADGHVGFAGVTNTFQTGAAQVRYRTFSLTVQTSRAHFDSSTNAYLGELITTGTSTCTVARYTGIQSRTGSYSEDVASGSTYANYWLATWGLLAGISLSGAVAYFSNFVSARRGGSTFGVSGTLVDNGDGSYTMHAALSEGGTPIDAVVVTCDPAGGNFSMVGQAGKGDGTTFYTDVEESMTVSNTAATYSLATYAISPTDSTTIIKSSSATATLTLADPYSAADCYADFRELLAAWSLSNAALYPFRGDEELANAPLVTRDEMQAAVQPALDYHGTMDDYAAGLTTDANGVSPGGDGYITTWAQTAWLDPLNYIWRFPDGSIGMSPPDGFTSGATLHTPFYSGAIIAANTAGSDRSFWFGFHSIRRTPQIIDGEPTGNYLWIFDKYGGTSDSVLPTTALRWMNKRDAQFDPLAVNDAGSPPPPGNLPQAFMRQAGSVIVGAKYVECPIEWPAVDYSRPCGPDKYAVDQGSVCCISSYVAGVFTVTQAIGLPAPGTPGGVQVGDVIAADGDNPGIYVITALAGTGPWLMTTTQLDDVPTGWTMTTAGNYIGKLRWPSAPGICGRAAITTAHDDDTNLLTITATVPQPYLRLDPASGEIYVDIYDAAMTLLASNVSLTRTDEDDSTFTVTHAALPSAAFMMAHGVSWPVPAATSQHTGIKLEWTFNARATDPAYPSPPAWYADTPGCTDGTITQFNYVQKTSCPAVVGIVPGDRSGVENFTNQVLYGFPAEFPFDDVYGAVWMAGIELTMVDPFYQTPFKPLCSTDPADNFTWKEDDGSGQDDVDATETAPAIKYFAHHPLVEAAANIPSGRSLPSGVSLFYAPGTEIAPPYYPNGLPIGDTDGNYGGFERPWGFFGAACATISGSLRFYADYEKFVLNCP